MIVNLIILLAHSILKLK